LRLLPQKCENRLNLMVLPNLLLQLGPLSVYSFGMILAAIFLVGVFLFWRGATREGFASDPIFDLIFLCTLSALFGGRLSFILLTGEPSLFNDPLAIFRVGEGIFWMPSFLLGLIAFYLYIRRRVATSGWSFFKLADLVVPIVALGQAIGFLGAQVTGYLSSVISPAFGYLGLTLILIFVKRKVVTTGVVFFLYLLLSGFLTVGGEYLRQVKAVALGIDLNYLLGATLLTAGFAGLLYQFLRSRKLFPSLQIKFSVPTFLGEIEKQLRFRLKVSRIRQKRAGGEDASSTDRISEKD